MEEDMTDYRERIEQTVDERLKGYKDLALQIHEKPEVSNYAVSYTHLTLPTTPYV